MKLLYFLILFALAAGGCEKKQTTDEVHEAFTQPLQGRWMNDLDKALTEAQKSKKPLIVMISEPDCRWCIKMKKGVLSDPRVQKQLERYLLVRIRRSDRVQSSKIESFDGKIPSFFLLSPKGEVVDAIVGYYKPDDFLGYLQEITEELK